MKAEDTAVIILMSSLIAALLWLIASAAGTRAAEVKNITELVKYIEEDYDFRQRPNCCNEPVFVRTSIKIEHFKGLQDDKQEFTLSMYYRQIWVDPRLKHSGLESFTYYGGDAYDIWIPDTYFLYEIKSVKHASVTSAHSLIIEPDGTIIQSTRFTETVACQLNMQQYPLDRQTCSLEFSSYLYSTRDVRLQMDDTDLSIEARAEVPDFDILNTTIMIYEKTYLRANYSICQVKFTFHRHWQNYILMFYCTSALHVVIAWLSFWIDASAAPARVALCITLILTVNTMITQLQSVLPKSHFGKVIDIWLQACLLFIFFALLEYSVANFILCRKAKQENETKRPCVSEVEGGTVLGYDNNYAREESQVASMYFPYFKLTAANLDRFSRVAFPVLFVIFNIVYWRWIVKFDMS